MYWILSLALADCPDFPVVLQTLSEDGAAWQLRSADGIQCLYRIDDQDDITLIRSWEGAIPLRMLPTLEGMVAIGDRSLLLLDGASRWRIPITLPALPETACFDPESGTLSLGFADGHWVIQVRDGTVQTRHGLGCG